MSYPGKTKEQLIWEFKSSRRRWGLWTGRDSHLRRLDEALRWQADRLQEQAELLDLANDSILVRDMEDRVLFWNQSAEQRYGWSKAEALGRVTHNLLSTVFPLPLSAIVDRLYKDGRWEGELTHTTRHGRQLVVYSLWSLRRDDSGQPQAILEINHDISHRKLREQQLLDYQARLRALAQELTKTEEDQRRVIAVHLHDGVGQYLAMCKLRLKMVGQAHPGIKDDLSEALSLLDQAIVETRSLTVELSPPVLHELGLAAALQWLVEQERERWGLDITLRAEDSPLGLDQEAAAFLFRAARELLLNVAKHAAAHNVELDLTQDQQRVRIMVADDGRGFPLADDQNPSGQGFGLFSLRERAESMGGGLETSNRSGGGARVAVWLPAPASAQEQE